MTVNNSDSSRGGSILNIKPDQLDEVKRKLRKLKKLEIKIRFGDAFHAANYTRDKGNIIDQRLVWNDFFHIGGQDKHKARYSFENVAAMSRDDFIRITDEYFFCVYYKYYTENGINASRLYDPEILGWMGLPSDAGAGDIKKKFRELAKRYHPDAGGDEDMFIELMDNYRKLIE